MMWNQCGWDVFCSAPAKTTANNSRDWSVPGVAILVRQELQATLPANISEKMVEWGKCERCVAVIVGDHYIGNLYAQASSEKHQRDRGSRIRLYEDIFVESACRTNVIIGGDWNRQPSASNFGFHAAMAKWTFQNGTKGSGDVNGGAGPETVPTYVSGEKSSSIDGYALDPMASLVVVGSEVDESKKLNHKPVHLDLRTKINFDLNFGLTIQHLLTKSGHRLLCGFVNGVGQRLAIAGFSMRVWFARMADFK